MCYSASESHTLFARCIMQPWAVVDVVQETGEVGAGGCVCGAASQHPHLQHLQTPLWHIRPILGALCLSTQQQSKSPSLLSHHYPGEREASMGQQRHSFLCVVSSKCVNPLPFPKALKLKQTNIKAPPAESAHFFSGIMCVCCHKCLLKVVLPIQHLILEAYDICRFLSLNHRKIPVLQYYNWGLLTLCFQNCFSTSSKFPNFAPQIFML